MTPKRPAPVLNSLLLVNIGQLLTLRAASTEPGPRRGPALKELGVIHDGAVLCLGGKIVCVGKTKDALRDPWLKGNRKGSPRSTAPAKWSYQASWTRTRIPSSWVRGWWISRSASKARLTGNCGSGRRHPLQPGSCSQDLEEHPRLAGAGRAAANGRAGYDHRGGQVGLWAYGRVGTEVAGGDHDAASRWPGTVVPTLLGAHVVPKEFQGCSQKYVEIVCKEMIPRSGEAEARPICGRVLRQGSVYRGGDGADFCRR